MERLVDAIKEGEVVRISESQALAEDLFILKRFDTSKFDYSAPAETVVQKSRVQEKSPNLFESWKRGDLVNKNNVISDLVPNFHWEILNKRRSKGLSRLQLASATGISESDLRLIEMGKLPSDDFVYISKIENHLGINLRRDRVNAVNWADLQKRQSEKKEEKKFENNPKVLGDEIEILDD